MRSVDFPEVQSDLSALVDEVERGGEIVITRDGRAVARLVADKSSPQPTLTPMQREAAREALRDIDALSRELNLGPFKFEEFKADRDAGRR